MAHRPLPDYYTTLQVTPEAEQAVIEAAYRQLARLYHPDMSDAPDAVGRMRALNDAYAVLRDPARRAAYNAQRAQLLHNAARLAEVRRDGEWYHLRLGAATDAFRALAALAAAVPPDARRWHGATQTWQVHADYEDALRQVFADFDQPSSHVNDVAGPLAQDIVWPLLSASAICLIALAILIYLSQTPTAVAWRVRTVGPLVEAIGGNPGTPSLLTLAFLVGLAAVVVGYIAWTLRHPSRR